MSTLEFCRHCNITQKTIYDTIELCAANVFKELGYGLGEAIYQNALAASIRKEFENKLKCLHATKSVEQETTIPIVCDSFTCGTMRTDIILHWAVGKEIKKNIIIELKSTATKLDEKNVLQLLAYLRATNTSRGLLLNFTQKSELVNQVWHTKKTTKKRKENEAAVSEQRQEKKREISISLEALALEPMIEFVAVFLN